MRGEIDMRLWRCRDPECRECLRVLGLYGARLLLWASKRGQESKIKQIEISMNGRITPVADLRDISTGNNLLDLAGVDQVVFIPRARLSPFYANSKFAHTPGHLAALVIHDQER